MRLGLALLCALLTVPGFSADQAALSSVKKVYLLPMGNGLDQYLANQLTVQNVFLVVTDPKLADALLTDQIGERFERQLKELYPPPEKKTAAATEKTEESKESTDTGSSGKEVSPPVQPPLPVSTFSRGKGNVFLINRSSRTVIWSTHFKPKDYRSTELNKAAAKIVAELRETVAPK